MSNYEAGKEVTCNNQDLCSVEYGETYVVTEEFENSIRLEGKGCIKYRKSDFVPIEVDGAYLSGEVVGGLFNKATQMPETEPQKKGPALSYIETESGFTVLVDGKPENVESDAPKYEKLLEAVKLGDMEYLRNNITHEKAVKSHFQNTGVEVEDGVVYYNGEEVHNSLTERILRYVEDDENPEHMILFLENLMENPSDNSREELYDFLCHKGLTLSEDGCFFAYKTVRNDYRDKYSGKFDNSVGQVIEMPREDVDDNAQRTCSHGFHVGTWEYAGHGGWYNKASDRVMLVKVNPKDAVSVPADHNATKLRVCRYEVVQEIEPEENFLDKSVHRLEQEQEGAEEQKEEPQEVYWQNQFYRHYEPARSFIESVRFVKGEDKLIVTIKGNRYQYTGVPEKIFEGFLSADKCGVYYNANIKGRYSEEKL